MDSLSAFHGFQRNQNDSRRILTSLGEVAYEWRLADDRLIWGANFVEVLGEVLGDALGRPPEDCFSTGADWENVCAPIADGSRGSALSQAQDSQSSNGSYNLRYCVRLGGDCGQSLIVDDSGRWFAGPDGKLERAHGLVRMSAPQNPGARQLDQARFMEALAHACAADGREHFALLLTHAPERILPVLQKSMRAGDVIAACGDKGIALLLRHCNGDQVQRAFQRLAGVAAQQAHEGLRGGAAIGGHDCAGALTLMHRASQALAKSSLTNPLIVRAASAASDEKKLRAICDDIVAALGEDRILIALQPIVDAQNGKPAFFEALVRMRTKAGTITGPSDILAAAEESGLVADLDQRVLELSLACLSASDGKIHGDCKTLSINVSGASLQDPAWPDRIKATLRGRESLARQLILEITETSAIADLVAAGLALKRLRALGFRIAMDDFGAGHTSFRNLRALDIDIVKIDGAFVRNLVDSEEDQLFVRTLHDLAKRIGARTVAEWVENAPCAALLAQWGVDYLQGAHFGMPIDVRHDLKDCAQ